MPGWGQNDAVVGGGGWGAGDTPVQQVAKPKTKGDVLWEQGTPAEQEVHGGTPFVGPMGVSPLSMGALRLLGKGIARGVIGKGVEKATEVGASMAGLSDPYANAVGQVAGMAATFAPRRVTDSVRDFVVPNKVKAKWEAAWAKNAPVASQQTRPAAVQELLSTPVTVPQGRVPQQYGLHESTPFPVPAAEPQPPVRTQPMYAAPQVADTAFVTRGSIKQPLEVAPQVSREMVGWPEPPLMPVWEPGMPAPQVPAEFFRTTPPSQIGVMEAPLPLPPQGPESFYQYPFEYSPGANANFPLPRTTGPQFAPEGWKPPTETQGLYKAPKAKAKAATPPPPPSAPPAEAYGGTVRNGVIYDEQGAPVAYQEGAAPKEAKPPMPSRTEGAPTLHAEPLAHQQGVEGGTIQGYLTRVNDIKLGRFLSDKGISAEQVRTMPEDQLNALVKEHNPKAKPLGKSGTFGRTVEAKREDLAKRIENVQKLTPEQYQKKLDDATREYQEQLQKAKGRGREGRRDVSKLQSLPFVPPPPVMA